jgi:hypothetical protein
MPILKIQDILDVTIQVRKPGVISVLPSDDAWDRAKAVLMNLKERASLPVVLHTESVAETIMSVRRRNGLVGLDPSIKDTDPPRYGDNEILIPAFRIGVRTAAQTVELANEIADYMRGVGLVVNVFDAVTES